MSSESAFSTRNCLERLRQASERFEVVSRSPGDMADDFLQYNSLQGEPFDQALQMHDKLPEALLVRALAKEGLEIIEQITWETYICKHSPEAARIADRLSALTELAKSWEAERADLERTIEHMNSLIQITMDAEKQLTDFAASLKNASESKTE